MNADNKSIRPAQPETQAEAISKQPWRSAAEAYAERKRSVEKLELAPLPPTGDVPAQLLNSLVLDLELPISSTNGLNNMNVQTIRDLIGTPEVKLVRVLGKRRFKELQDKLSELGIMP